MRLLSKPWPTTLLLLLAIAAPLTRAADPGPATQPDPAADRLTFLTLQLSSIEASLHAVNVALRSAGYKAVLTSEKADEAAKGNELMDRNGGAPIAWDKFYGATAKQFEPRDIYGVPHPYQRPSQFDYLYHANNDQVAKANAEVASLSQKIDVLLARRRQLDAEQSALWATISWESLQNRDIPLNPLYRFLLKAKTSTAATDARCDLLRPAILFLRTIDQTVADDLESLSTNQEATLTDLATRTRSAYTAAKEPFANAMLSADLDANDLKTAKDLLTSLKHLAELSKNITEAYRLALDGDAANDDNRKLTFRAQLQFALLDYATAAGDLDDRLIKLASAWDLESEKGVVNSDLIPKSTPKISPANVPSSDSAPSPAIATPQGLSNPQDSGSSTGSQHVRRIDLLKLVDPVRDAVDGIWTMKSDVLIGALAKGGKSFTNIEFPYSPPAEYDFRVEFVPTDSKFGNGLLCFGRGHQFQLCIGEWGNTVCGFGILRGKQANANPTTKIRDQWISTGRKYTAFVKVRESGVEAFLDNELIASLNTDYSDFRKLTTLHHDDTIGFGSEGGVEVISAEIVEVRGEGKMLYQGQSGELLTPAPKDTNSVVESPLQKGPLVIISPFKHFNNSLNMTLIQIPPGRFEMGSATTEVGRYADETQHMVTLTQGFYMAATPTTIGQWHELMGMAPASADRENLPFAGPWDEAVKFCEKLSEKEGKKYRLPTEAEWEYACRAGTRTKYFFGDNDNDLPYYTFFKSDHGTPHIVGTKKPNAWGLYDMQSTTWQWCSDWYDKDTYNNGAATDPIGPADGKSRVMRGGSGNPRAMRSAKRNSYEPHNHWAAPFGFRVVMDLN